MSIPTRHLSPHWDSPEHPLPAPAPASACLGTLLLCGSKDDQVWECCSLTFTMCAPAAGSVPAAKPQAGSGWLLLGPPSPSLPPALSFTHHTGRKSIPGSWKSTAPCTAAARIPRFKAVFWKESRGGEFLACAWRKGLEILAAA